MLGRNCWVNSQNTAEVEGNIKPSRAFNISTRRTLKTLCEVWNPLPASIKWVTSFFDCTVGLCASALACASSLAATSVFGDAVFLNEDPRLGCAEGGADFLTTAAFALTTVTVCWGNEGAGCSSLLPAGGALGRSTTVVFSGPPVLACGVCKRGLTGCPPVSRRSAFN